MAVLVLLVLLIASSCTPLHTANWIVITETPEYTIIQNRNDGKYLVYTDTAARADAIIQTALECKTRICVVAPHGVVTEVQRFDSSREHGDDKQSKPKQSRPSSARNLLETPSSVPSSRH